MGFKYLILLIVTDVFCLFMDEFCQLYSAMNKQYLY